MSPIKCRFQIQSLIQHLHYHRRYSCNSPNFKVKFDYYDDHHLLAYVREQCQSGFHDLEFPLSLFRQLMDLPRRPSIIDFNRLFSAVVKSKHLKPHSTVISLFRELDLWGVRPDSHSIGIITNCYCHLGRVDFGFSFLGKSLKVGYPFESDWVIFTTLINGLIHNNQLREAVKLLDKAVVKLGIEPSHVTYGTMIKGLCSVGDNAGALRLLRRMNFRPSGCKPDLVMYSTLNDSLCNDTLLDEALTFFSVMKTAPDVLTYTSIIRGLFNVCRKRDAKEMLGEMSESNIVPNVTTYSMLVDMHCKDGMMDEAESV
ncbi:hypothetical protein RND81_12G168300 [Saponaria officinalis]|uniref:Pentatricopeptide repeat-containing protein n=1 Tax=Saponaria officinalis TaxID=3572 RepID=A0AAW1HBN4_SAPOF